MGRYIISIVVGSMITVSLLFVMQLLIVTGKQALTDPTFGQEAIDRVRAQVVSGIRSDATDPGDIASSTFTGPPCGGA